MPGIIKHNACARCCITFYCSKACQKQHWKQGGHKQKCLPPQDRKAKKLNTAAQTKIGTAEKNEDDNQDDDDYEERKKYECAICLEDLRKKFAQCVLPCSHVFHKDCVSMLREAGVAQVCPLCRAQLPQSAEKMFADGASIYFPMRDRLEQFGGSWGHLSTTETKKVKELLQFWLGSAQQGHTKALFNLGVMHENGYGVQQSYEKALDCYEKAAEQGDAIAQYNLGYLYRNGHGVEQSYEKAVERWKKAAHQGHAEAQNNVGNMYRNGHGVKQSYEKAVEWFEKSAKQGLANAQYNLGNMYQNGHGVNQRN